MHNPLLVIRVPAAHGEGNYEAEEETLKRLEGEGCDAPSLLFGRRHRRRCPQFNGAVHSIGGIVNERANNELLLQMKRAPKYLRQAQAEWLTIAEKQLSA